MLLIKFFNFSRDRIIQILALKSYMKAELILKLNKENPLTDREKESLESIIQSVATLNPKNSQFEILNDIMVNEVKEDWPYYNEAQRLIVKKNISKAKTNTNSSLNTSQTSSMNTSVSNRPLPTSLSSSTLNANKGASSAFVSIQHSSDTNKTQSNQVETMNDSINSISLNNKKISPVKNEQFKPIPSSSSSKISPSGSKQVKHNQLFTPQQPKFGLFTGSPNSDDLLSDNESPVKKQPIEKENSKTNKKLKLDEPENFEAELKK